VNSYASRSPLGWAIPSDDWEKFVAYVTDEWGENTEHVRFALERAMIEFLELDDDLAEAERLLRDHLDVRGLSSSTAEALKRDVDPEDKLKIGVRVRDVLQDRFRSFVAEEFNGGKTARYATYTQSHTTYGEALTAAINEYRDGGAGRRLKSFAEDIVAGRDRSSNLVENPDESNDDLSTANATSITDGGPTVQADVVLDVADDLTDGFHVADLDDAIEEHAADEHGELSDDLLDEYREAVIEEKPVVEHPGSDGVYITEEERAKMTVWEDLNKETRVARLRRLVAADAVDKRQTHLKVDYQRVRELFAEDLRHEPSHQYAYDVMDRAGTVAGFSYGDHRGSKVLKCNLGAITDGLRRDLVENWGCACLASTPAEETDTDERPTDPDGWVDDVVEAVKGVPASAILDIAPGKIAQHKYATPADLNEDGTIYADDRLDELEAKVTEEDVERVRDRLGIDAPEDNSDATEDKSPAASDAPDTDAIDEELDALDTGAGATVATDGGHPATD